MQAIIMAAGKGSRLGELTGDKPKSFLKINGRSIFEYNLAMLHKYGIWDIIIVVGYHDLDFIKATQDIPGIKLIYNPFYEFTNVIGSYFLGMEYLHDSVVYMHADTLCDTEIFEDMLKNKGDVVLPIDIKSCDDEAMKVRMEGDKIVEITKNMNNDSALGEFIGICKIKKEVLPFLNSVTVELMREKKFKSYFEGALQRVLDTGKYDFSIVDIAGRFWKEVDFREDYDEAVTRISANLVNLFL